MSDEANTQIQIKFAWLALIVAAPAEEDFGKFPDGPEGVFVCGEDRPHFKLTKDLGFEDPIVFLLGRPWTTRRYPKCFRRIRGSSLNQNIGPTVRVADGAQRSAGRDHYEVVSPEHFLLG